MRLMVFMWFLLHRKIWQPPRNTQSSGHQQIFANNGEYDLNGCQQVWAQEFKFWFSNQMNKGGEKFYLTYNFSNCLQKSACDCSGHAVQPTYMCSIIFNPQSHFTQKEMKHFQWAGTEAIKVSFQLYSVITLLTLHILEAGTVLKVLIRLAETPGGGSNTNTRPARSRLVGSWKSKDKRYQHTG